MWREENRSTQRKALGAGTRTNNKLNPHMMPRPGRTRATSVGQASASNHHCAIPAPSRLPPFYVVIAEDSKEMYQNLICMSRAIVFCSALYAYCFAALLLPSPLLEFPNSCAGKLNVISCIYTRKDQQSLKCETSIGMGGGGGCLFTKCISWREVQQSDAKLVDP